jgi:peptidoglycan hydrolase CwlO-like protein
MLRKTIFAILIVGGVFFAFGQGHAAVQDEIDARNKQIAELQKQIAEYQSQILETSSKAKTLSTEITRLNANISKIQLEVKSLNLSITQTDSEIGVTQKTIQEKLQEIKMHKASLSSALQTMYELERQNLTQVLVGSARLSDYFSTVKGIDDAQNILRTNILALRDLKVDLEVKETNLVEKKTELQQLKTLQESQRKSLDSSKLEKDTLLKQTKGEESKYQSLVKETQTQINRIREQIGSLQQSGLAVQDVITYGVKAANSVKIRPGYLIAVLEVESNLGKNVGKGNWNDDMYQCYLRIAAANPAKKDYYTKRAEDEKAAYFKIVNGLGIDPNSVKVSAEPNYGCGGAMGPAQFIPTTWAGYAEQVSKITGHYPANPWNIEDAFTAAAIKLAKGGATQGKDGEIRASKAYISGNANCTTSICNYYANLVQQKAAIIELNLAK